MCSFFVQLFRNKSHTLHKIQLTVVRFFLLNLYRFIVTLQKKNVESGTVQEKMDMMKKCKLCFLCTIIDLPMKDKLSSYSAHLQQMFQFLVWMHW